MVKSCGVVVVGGGGPRDYTVSFLGLAIAIPISRPRPRSLTIFTHAQRLSRMSIFADIFYLLWKLPAGCRVKLENMMSLKCEFHFQTRHPDLDQ